MAAGAFDAYGAVQVVEMLGQRVCVEAFLHALLRVEELLLLIDRRVQGQVLGQFLA